MTKLAPEWVRTNDPVIRSPAVACWATATAPAPEQLGSNPGQGSKGINFSGWHGLDMSVTVTKRR